MLRHALATLLVTASLTALMPAPAVARDLGERTRDSARAFAADYLGPIVRPDTGRVKILVPRCRVYSVGWDACRVLVRGATNCSAVARLRPRQTVVYVGWMPRLNCR